MEMIKKNLWVKVASLFLAVILWSFVMTNENPNMTLTFSNIPVEYKNLDSINSRDILILQPKNPTVDITIQGKRNDIRNVDRSQIVAEVDLAGYGNETISIPVKVQTPSNTFIKSISDRTLLFKFEKLVRKSIPIEVDTVGDFPQNNIVLTSKTTDPVNITISGANSIVNSVKKAFVMADISKITDDTSINLPIQLLGFNNEEITKVDKSQSFINANITVNYIKEVPIELVAKTIPPGFELSKAKLSIAKIKIIGPKAEIDKVTVIKTQPVDFSKISGSSVVSVLDIPSGVKVKDGPNQVNINIE